MLPTGNEKQKMVRSMFDAIAPRYDLVNRVMTFGMDRAWRRKTVTSLGLDSDSLVADIACGTGDLCIELRKQRMRAIGFDLSLGMLSSARTTSPLVQADALRLPVKDGSMDGITCGFALRNVVDLDLLFGEMARVLRSGGRIAILEVATPENYLLRAGHALYFKKIVPVVGALLSDRKAYAYLPRSTAYLPSTQELLRKLVEAGFKDASRELMGPGAAQLIHATRA